MIFWSWFWGHDELQHLEFLKVLRVDPVQGGITFTKSHKVDFFDADKGGRGEMKRRCFAHRMGLRIRVWWVWWWCGGDGICEDKKSEVQPNCANSKSRLVWKALFLCQVKIVRTFSQLGRNSHNLESDFVNLLEDNISWKVSRHCTWGKYPLNIFEKHDTWKVGIWNEPFYWWEMVTFPGETLDGETPGFSWMPLRSLGSNWTDRTWKYCDAHLKFVGYYSKDLWNGKECFWFSFQGLCWFGGIETLVYKFIIKRQWGDDFLERLILQRPFLSR